MIGVLLLAHLRYSRKALREKIVECFEERISPKVASTLGIAMLIEAVIVAFAPLGIIYVFGEG